MMKYKSGVYGLKVVSETPRDSLQAIAEFNYSVIKVSHVSIALYRDKFLTTSYASLTKAKNPPRTIPHRLL